MCQHPQIYQFESLHQQTESCSVMSNSLRPHGLQSPRNSPGQNIELGSLSLLQGIFPTQGSNPGLLHCRHILYQLRQKGSPHGATKCCNFILLHVAVQFSQHHLFKRLPLPHCIVLPSLSKRRYPQMCGFICGLSILFHWSIFSVFVPVPYCLHRSSQKRTTSASSPLLVWAQTQITMILNGLPWKRTEIILSFLRLHPSTTFQTLLLTIMATPFF